MTNLSILICTVAGTLVGFLMGGYLKDMGYEKLGQICKIFSVVFFGYMIVLLIWSTSS